MNFLKNIYAIAFVLASTVIFAQTQLTGKVVDESNTGLPGASVVVEGTTDGASADFDGNFTVNTANASGQVKVSFVGYTTKMLDFNGTTDFGTIQLMPSAESLDEVVIVGIADIAKERETPVAVSTIKATEIIERLGTQELPELLNATPSVYATKQGGGYGDARINVRGFDQRNTAVLINGVPVNDMENGWVYWSNWAGLSDVTTAMQVQRGLGSSKLAISSVGGTINVLTKTSDAREGGNFSATYGNDNFLKVLGSYSTGKMESGFSASVLLSQFQGDGYADGTKFQGNTYFIGFGYEINDNNSVMFTATGAPQWHHQRYYAPNIKTYMKYSDTDDPNIKYNGDWGYLNGEEFTWRRNFYHKPVASLNWDLKFNETSSLSTVLYSSWGRGGGTGPIGKINGAAEYYGQFKDADGLTRFDDIVAWNSGNDVPDFGDVRESNEDGLYINERKKGLTRRASMNSHDWYGLISNFHKDVNDNFGIDFGIDARTYTGMHYRIVNDDLGADGYNNTYKDVNNPDMMITEYYEANPSWNPFVDIAGQQKIEYYNDGNVHWIGAFGQLEYKNDQISTFLQFGGSQQGFQRVDYFNYLNSDPEQTTDWQNILGGNVKGGLNYNINEKHNVFANAGYYSKQPGFDAIFLNYKNDVNEDRVNEKVLGVEVGYGFRSERASVNLNLYRTSWADRYEHTTAYFGDTGYGVDILGVTELHSGIEADITYRPLENLSLKGMVSVGDWEYSGSPNASVYDDNNEFIGEYTLYLDGVKVGDAAQFTSRLGMTWEVFKNFKLDMSQFFADNLYADIDATSFNYEGHPGALKLPAYSLTDMGVSYKFNLSDSMGLSLRANVNNLWDDIYISESETNYHISDYTSGTWNGIDTGNRVYFGFGRTWNVSARFNF